MITDADVRKLKRTFVTKEELNSSQKKLINELDHKLNKNTERIIEAVSDMLSTKADREDIEVYQRQLDNHEDWILTLEKAIN